MRLFVSPFAPNALRAQVVMAERALGIEVVNASADPDAYRAVNPLGQVPALALDDGRVITESLTVSQYLDQIAGPPYLFGDSSDERLTIAMWERRAETALFNPAVEYGHHMHPMFAGRTPQFPDYAASLAPKIVRAVTLLTDRLASSAFVAGERFTAADVTAALGMVYALAYRVIDRQQLDAGERWFEGMLARDSMAGARMFMAMTATS